MKGKILKFSVIIVLILAMTMTDFVFVGSSIISYAIDSISTNNSNIEFSAYFKNDDGEQTTSIEKGINNLDTRLYLKLKVKQEGYFNGKIILDKSNFTLKESENEYINSIEGNNINLNQINAGTEVELDIPVEFVREEKFDLNLLSMESEIRLEGIYRDSSEKDKEIKANRKLTLKILPENTTSDNIENSATIITNKTLQVAGVDKRVIQVLLNVGLKDNSYPIKEINISTNVPDMNEKQPEISASFNFNSMRSGEYNYSDNKIEINLKNKEDSDYIIWKEKGNDSVVVTYLYDKDGLEDITINGSVEVKLYDDTAINTDLQEIIVNKDDEKEEIVTTKIENSESVIYKGRLNKGIDKSYETKILTNVNATNIVDYIELKEDDVFVLQNGTETKANTIYNSTIINKEQLLDVIGEDGIAEIKNENDEIIATITKDTAADENGNIVINYGELGQSEIIIKTTAPVSTGKIEIKNNKTIKENDIRIVKNSVKFNNKLTLKTNLNESLKEAQVDFKDSITSATLEINKTELSTVVENNVQIKATLKSKNDSNDLFKNPILKIELPEEVENVEIENISILYGDGLEVANYSVNGKILTINISGEQTNYSESAVEGVNIIINGKLKLNNKSATKDSKIVLTYSNENATSYENDAKAIADIKIVAPTDVTTVTTIEELGVEEINQNETKEIVIERGAESKEITSQIEVINNKSSEITDVKILGVFPTAVNENSIKVKVLSLINTEDAKVYYTENANATEDLENNENSWMETIENPSEVKKYLIVVAKVDPQNSVKASYESEIPANLEYNENSEQKYQVTYTDSSTNTNDTVESTNIKMTTGVGPELKSTLKATVGEVELKDGDKVKAGEVIKYHIEVSNTGTEDAKNIVLSSYVPEGTTLVEPADEYEYIGARYYEEKGNDDCREEIAQIKVGETIVREYEVRVDSDITNGTQISNKANTEFDDVKSQSNELKNILESGDLRVTVKRITDRSIKLKNNYTVTHEAIIENTSNKTLNNVKIKTNLEGSQVALLELISIKDDDYDNVEKINYQEELNIGNMLPGEKKVLRYVSNIQNNGKVILSVDAIQGNSIYRSNVWKDNVEVESISINMSSPTSKYLKGGNIIEYVITITNNGATDIENLTIIDSIPKELSLREIKIDNNVVDLTSTNKVSKNISLKQGEQKTITIKAIVNDDILNVTEINNKAIAEYRGSEIASADTITNILQPNQQVNDNENNNNDNTNTNANTNENTTNNNNNVNENSNTNPDNGNVATSKNIISGTAWYDENNNGKKDDNEQTLNGIKVYLVNAETNDYVKDSTGNNILATTSSSGTYLFSDIPNGKYIVVFDYNSTAYAVTKYKVTGVEESKNSNAMMNDINIDGNSRNVASTDIIQIINTNVSDINIGLIKLQNFDLKLDKTVSRILIQNSDGTTIKEFNDTMSKIELPAKQINNTTVVVEYKIKVTNVGEVAGYAKKIVDYMPSDFKFSSELNKDWYEANGYLYNTSLTNEKIAAGETKELTLTLTKAMTENNTGLTNNTAEIVESYNELGVVDSNSTPGNKTQGENDMGSADTIISVGTGSEVVYTVIAIMLLIAVLGGTAIPVIKKSKKEKNRHKFDKI